MPEYDEGQAGAGGSHVRANGIRQHYLLFGTPTSEPPLLIVPGITSPAATWSGVGLRLCEDRAVYILDVRGRGLSESGPHLDYALDACAADLLAFVQALGLSGAIVLGHSMGGRIAARAFAGSAVPSRLVLVDPPLSGPGRPSRVKPVEAYLALVDLAKHAGDPARLRAATPRLSPADLRLRLEWLPTCDSRAVAVAHAGFSTDDIWPDIRRLAVPTLLMVAGDHALITPDDIAAIEAEAPILSCTIIDAGHMIPMENRAAFQAALAAFLARPDAAAGC